MKPGRNSCDASGFTLLEMMLGAVLFGMVSLSVYGVFSQGLRVEHRLRNATVANQELFWAMETMVRDLQLMVSYTMSDGEKGYFLGEDQQVAFVIAEGNSLKEVRYEIVEPELDHIHRVEVRDLRGEDAQMVIAHKEETEDRLLALVRKTRDFPHYLGGEDGFQERILTRIAKKDGLKFLYFTRDENGEGIWKERCDGSQWPEIIRIDLSLLSKDRDEMQMIRDVLVPLSGLAIGAGYAGE